MICLATSQHCVLILSNDVRSEAGFAELVRFILGDAGVPYDWEYGTTPERRELSASSVIFHSVIAEKFGLSVTD